MKTSLLRVAGAMLLALSVSSLANANPFNGTLYFGLTTTANVDLTADTVTFAGHPNANVGVATGDYAVLLGASVNISDFTYSGAGLPTVIWVSTSGPAANFTVNYWSRVTEDTVGGGLLLWGEGTATLAGFDPTSGRFTFSSSQTGNTEFSFSAVSTAPDGGTTALLVGLGLVGMSVVARRRK